MLPVLFGSGTWPIHIKPPLSVIRHPGGRHPLWKVSSWMQCIQTRFLEGICFRYVQPTIVVVKRMLCWATPLNNQLQLSSFLDPRHARQVFWVGQRTGVDNTLDKRQSILDRIQSILGVVSKYIGLFWLDQMMNTVAVLFLLFGVLHCKRYNRCFDVLKRSVACLVKMRPGGGVEEQAQHCQQGLPCKLWVCFVSAGLLVVQQSKLFVSFFGACWFVSCKHNIVFLSILA